MFGPIGVQAGDSWLGPRDFGGIKPKQLIEALLLERGRAVAKEDLAERLWGTEMPESVAGTIETYVSIARKRLPHGRRLIETSAGGYRIAADELTIDLAEFDSLVQRAASGEPSRRKAHLESCVALAADPVLADEPYADWVAPVRRLYAERRLQAIVGLAECCLGLGDFEAAAANAKKAIGLDSILERAGRCAMLAFYALGDQGQALRVYAQLRAALADELGVVPMPETSQLHEGILRHEAIGELMPSELRQPRPIRFADSNGVAIAYQAIGSGPPDIVFLPEFVTNLGATWDEPHYSDFLRRLAGLGRLVLFDKRGTGLSDPVVDWPGLEARADDIGAVLDASGSQKAILFGVCDGGILCGSFAARHPDRVAGLVLFAVPAATRASEEFPWAWSDRFFQAFARSFEQVWDGNMRMDRYNPSIANDPRYGVLLSRFLRLGASPGVARRLATANRDIDIRPLMSQIQTPTLVVTRANDPWIRVENSRYIAAQIPGAELLELAGDDHEPWVGDTDAVLNAVGDFITRLGAVHARR